MPRCRAKSIEGRAYIIRKYAAAYLPAADVQMMMHGTAARVFKWPAE